MRYVFFSSDWDDSWRAMQVRNSNVVKSNDEFKASYIDAADVEEVKKKTKAEIKKWINEQMKGTSVTCVLIGEKTSESDWVAYEIEQSIDRGNGLLGIYIHNVKDQNGEKGKKGKNPLSQDYATYDWVNDDGRNNLADWVEAAAVQAGK
jgi:preprotein translocase subunit SecD